MKKSISVKHKSVGRPATGQKPLVGFRAKPEFRAEIVRWSEEQDDRPTLSEAVRRLVELGLTVKPKARQRAEGQKDRAKEFAGKAIDKMSDADASADDRAGRKRRLLKGPEEFQDVRVDRPKSKK